MKKLLILCLALSMSIGCMGCSKGEDVHDVSSCIVVGDEYGTFEWISPDGVHYWIYNNYQRFGMAPRYDHNGQLIID